MGCRDGSSTSLFTVDKPVIFNFHAYASLIHKLTYRRTNHDNFHVRGYKEKGNINTPLELAILNQIDRFDLAIDVIDRVPRLQATAAHTKEWLKDQIIESVNYAHENGIDRQEDYRSGSGRCKFRLPNGNGMKKSKIWYKDLTGREKVGFVMLSLAGESGCSFTFR